MNSKYIQWQSNCCNYFHDLVADNCFGPEQDELSIPGQVLKKSVAASYLSKLTRCFPCSSNRHVNHVSSTLNNQKVSLCYTGKFLGCSSIFTQNLKRYYQVHKVQANSNSRLHVTLALNVTEKGNRALYRTGCHYILQFCNHDRRFWRSDPSQKP